MPIPKPRRRESEEAFLGRCMADPVMNADYPDRDQRFAVCASQLPGKKVTKQTTAAQDLRQKLELERYLLREIDKYHTEILRDFTRLATTAGAAPDAAARNAALTAILMAHYQRVAGLFSGQLSRRLPAPKRLTETEKLAIAAALQQYFEKRAPEQAALINATTNTDQREVLQNARQEQPALPVPELGLIASAALSRRLAGRRQGIAITETQAPAEATKATEAETLGGLPPSVLGGSRRQTEMIKTWDAVLDSSTRGAHVEADGQEQPMNQPFYVGGQELMFPGDTSRGASVWNIVNCRCGVTYDTKAIEENR